MHKIQLTQDTPEWLNFRKTKIGASDCPIIMGVSPWKTAYKLWREKLSLDDEIVQSWAMERGKTLEPIARVDFTHKTGIEVNPYIGISSKFNWMMASLDGLSADGKTLVEIKCPGTEDHRLAFNGKIPEKYMPQLQHQMYVCELDEMYYYSFDGKEGIKIKVYLDESYSKSMIKKETEFWECMQERIPPVLDEKDYRIRSDPEFCTAASNWKSVNEQIKDLEKKEKEARDILIKLAENSNCKGEGVSLCKIARKGNVEYSKIPELQNINLDVYRKPISNSWRVLNS